MLSVHSIPSLSLSSHLLRHICFENTAVFLLLGFWSKLLQIQCVIARSALPNLSPLGQLPSTVGLQLKIEPSLGLPNLSDRGLSILKTAAFQCRPSIENSSSFFRIIRGSDNLWDWIGARYSILWTTMHCDNWDE